MRRRVITLTAVGLALLAACESSKPHASPSSSVKGVLELAAGACSNATTTGSTFRMVQSGGTPEKGPYVTNGDSPCADKTVTPLAPGADGGLRLGAYQPQPNPPFSDGGASLAVAVIRPAAFFAVPFGISTNPTDPQTGSKVLAPSVIITGTKLTADLSAISVSWNGQHFNQGAPKPGGAGLATGTYDPASGHYTLEWTSAIKGGPFNGFIGIWHFEGTLRRAS